ncbi:MAG: STAS/SEC14 domain-containing protein [Candidatus Buchananbacteria bacterium]|nr:STAS/SEC14 domain-containing protein [Candidatus Buchananbacteria bacterium]
MTEINKTFKIYGDNEGVLYLDFLENVQDVASNVSQAEGINQKLNQIFSDHPEKKFKLLVDLSLVSQSAHYPSPRARAIFAEMAGKEQLERIAVVAPNTLSRAIMGFVIRAANAKKPIKFFSTRADASAWLK